TWVNTHLAYYHQLAQIDKSLAEFTVDFNIMSMQRHLKVLGIFVRLFERDGKDRYLTNLPKVFNDLLTCLKAITQCDEHHTFDKFADWMTAVVEPAFHQKIQG
ncbi:MAG TPA: aminoglycoside phosphotransferase, partial [Moraxellaceae bacterium]|nr:aminoglycoside phosphotransferase [Moraxellaceae bacterium]